MNILSIGGSDPSSGAGIQGDLRTGINLGVYVTTAITAITSQNTSKFNQIQTVSSKMILSQINSILSDFRIDAIVLSMIYNKKNIDVIYSKLKNLKIPIVVDPVITSTTGGTLLQKSAVNSYRKKILPLATIITPNSIEAEIISNKKIVNENDILECIRILQKKHNVNNIVITGYEKEGKVIDYIAIKNKRYVMSQKKLPIANHGSGSVFATGIAVGISQGKSIIDSIRFSRLITLQSIKNSKKIGKGIHITELDDKDTIKSKLSKEIQKFQQIKNSYKLIPECQTNFVFSKDSPKGITDIAGVQGRIVKAGESTVVAGEIEFGGSKHVATAVFEINKKFPRIRSAINIKFDSETLLQFKKSGFSIAHYDRGFEPKSIKTKENSSIEWGIRQAIANKRNPPDIIYHKGDFGKEPMILLFGISPSDVLKKLKSVTSQRILKHK